MVVGKLGDVLKRLLSLNPFLFCLFLLFPLSLFSEVKMTVDLKKDSLQEGRPIEGELTIQHSQDKVINTQSAYLEGKRLILTFIKEIQSREGVKSTYRFQIDKKSSGLHILGPITIEVGGTTVRSPQITYEVKGKNEEKVQESTLNVDGNLIFKLEPIIEGKKIFYPRQRATFGYRYIFNESIELKEENLPLLEPEGFKKIGNEEIENFRRTNVGIREIKQKVEAVTPGRYTIGPSSIEGLPYQLTLFRTKEYYDKPVKATTEAIALEIKPFPEKGRPPSFNGAIGKDLKFRSVLQSFSDVNVGDKITLALEISGDGEVENAPMPDLCCQPGFPGKFRQSDIPPAEIMKGGMKFFVIDLFPLSTSIREIPSIEFSFFDPDSEAYRSVTSDPIPITVRPTAEGIRELKEVEDSKKAPTETDWPKLTAKPPRIEIQTIFPLTPQDLRSRFLGSPYALWLLLFIPIVLFLQVDLRKRGLRRRRVDLEKTEDLWKEIDSLPRESTMLAPQMTRLLLERLKEQGLIKNNAVTVSELEDTGIVGEVKRFLTKLEEERFGKGKKSEPEELKKEGKRLFDKIKTS